MAKPKKPYQKHIYWLHKAQVPELENYLRTRDMRLRRAKGIVCTPMDRINRVACVAPDVWNGTCRRQGSWYRASEKNGRYLIISSFDLNGFESEKTALITESDFVLDKPASNDEKDLLFEDPELKKRMPLEWHKVEDVEERVYLRWARRLGSSVNAYDELYRTHTANHANFINPRFYLESSHGIIPYSIDRSAHICSCCVELFQILGAHFKKKLVAPCPGAVIFARLKPDRYLLVEKP